MFTGIIEAVGKIKKVMPIEGGVFIEVIAGGLDLSDVGVGDSIATNGVCLTIIALAGNVISMQVSRETLNCTQSLDIQGEGVNLEKAMQLSDRVNGHLVSGHVDGVGKIIKLESAGENYILTIKPPDSLMRYIVKKGSIAVNGVSLTVNLITKDGGFMVNLIPHTIEATTFKELKVGMEVNLEIDMFARYAEQFLILAPMK
ncbi:MAG: riboflavin synthase [Nitrosomonadaceae bacterium]|nr:riboflavin synthase [Nitrosomonadaceae bacterium]|tara:strand:- start:1122 stop:1724 length:603 start_codon:yes stop_codon:yes gene_type:complete